MARAPGGLGLDVREPRVVLFACGEQLVGVLGHPFIAAGKMKLPLSSLSHWTLSACGWAQRYSPQLSAHMGVFLNPARRLRRFACGR